MSWTRRDLSQIKMLTKTVVALLVSNIINVQCLPQIGLFSDINQINEEQNQDQIVQKSPHDISQNILHNQNVGQNNLQQSQNNRAQNNVQLQQNQNRITQQFLENVPIQTTQTDLTASSQQSTASKVADILYNQNIDENKDSVQQYGSRISSTNGVGEIPTLHGRGSKPDYDDTHAIKVGYKGSFPTQNKLQNVKNVYSQQSDIPQHQGLKQTQSKYKTSEQAAVRNANYHFGYQIDDNINGGYNERQEQRENGKVAGYYVYDDGNILRRVSYEADENGFRVISDDVLPSEKNKTTLSGVAEVKVYTDGTLNQYAIRSDQISSYRKSAVAREDDQEA